MNLTDPHRTLDGRPFVEGMRVYSPYANCLQHPECYTGTVGSVNPSGGWANVRFECGMRMLREGHENAGHDHTISYPSNGEVEVRCHDLLLDGTRCFSTEASIFELRNHFPNHPIKPANA